MSEKSGMALAHGIGWPRRPDLRAEVLREFELQGVDHLRSLLITNPPNNEGRNQQIPFEKNGVTRGAIQDWLKWKAEKDTFWIRLGIIAAVVAAVFSIIAVVRPASGCVSPTLDRPVKEAPNVR
jgi:hypothetical protein